MMTREKLEVCPKCDSPEIEGVIYEKGFKYRYDGVCEYVCSCGYRQGRWCGKELKHKDEYEPAFHEEWHETHPTFVDLTDDAQETITERVDALS